MNVIDYVTEEVRRQGHDVVLLDGIERVGWMLNAWAHAIEHLREKQFLSADDIVTLGRMVEPHKNYRGLRNCGVRVGLRSCPHPNEVSDLLERWLRTATVAGVPPLDAYRAFEEIHPFLDGNGRTGKILLNLLNGTLHDPIFPPADFWGRTIQNP